MRRVVRSSAFGCKSVCYDQVVEGKQRSIRSSNAVLACKQPLATNVYCGLVWFEHIQDVITTHAWIYSAEGEQNVRRKRYHRLSHVMNYLLLRTWATERLIIKYIPKPKGNMQHHEVTPAKDSKNRASSLLEVRFIVQWQQSDYLCHGFDLLRETLPCP